MSRPFFLSNGLTTAVFHSVAKVPDNKDKFTNLFIRGKSVVTNSLINFEDTGSDGQVVGLEFMMTFKTSCSLTDLKLNCSKHFSYEDGSYNSNASKSFRIFFYFIHKIIQEIIC